MLHAHLDESGTHELSEAVAVVAAVATPAIWEKFNTAWVAFLTELGLRRWHHRDFDKRRNDYGTLTSTQLDWARERLCEIVSDAGFFFAGTAVGRTLYETVRAAVKWQLPRDPYNFCLERCLHQVIKRVFSSHNDEGIVIFYDNERMHGRNSRDLTRWHRETFEPSHLSQYKDRTIDLKFLEAPDMPARAVPDIIAFEACAYVQAHTGIPFLGAKLIDGETPEPRPIIKRLMDSQRVAMAVTTYTDWFLDIDLDHADVVLRDNASVTLASKFWR